MLAVPQPDHAAIARPAPRPAPSWTSAPAPAIPRWRRADGSATRSIMGDLDRLVPSGIIEQWVYHLRRQRARALDALWLIDQGYTLHDGRHGVPTDDATARWRSEQETVVAEVNALLALYDSINLGQADDQPA